MDWQFKVGLGVAVVFGLLPFAVKDLPPWVTWSGLTIGALFVIWGFLPNHEKIPTWMAFIFIACAAGTSGSGIAIWKSFYLPTSATGPNISFQKFALFWVEVDKEIYQLGVVTKFFNLDSTPYLINGVVFDGDSWTFFPRGSYLIKKYAAYEDHVELIEDNYIKSGNEAYFKKLLPIKFDMTISNGSTPDFALRGEWILFAGGAKMQVVPPLFSVYHDLFRPKNGTTWRSLSLKLMSIPFSIRQFHHEHRKRVNS
jgi:hypothetical protein